jgi:glutathione S-transferase
MKLYYAPGACSLASRISLHEAGIAAEFERVDLQSKTTERGEDFAALNPKGYVPLLVLDNGKAVTENIAVLLLIADCEAPFEPGNPLGRIRLVEMLSYLSTELHPAFKPFWHASSDAEKAVARENVTRRLELVADGIRELYLFGPRFSIADAYLFVMLRWAKAFSVWMPLELLAYFERVAERPSVRRALAEEGLPNEAPQPVFFAAGATPTMSEAS